VTSTVVALPTSSDREDWSAEQAALVEAAGLVAVDSQSGAKTLAPRPVVAAFLQHSSRTGLDPIARQIYCIARKQRGEYKWQIQISIDGARLVAERTGQYEGQTTPEFTSDGVTWTQVWLGGDTQPKAARVGVYRRGFREPLYAVALWEAYAVYQDVWENGRKTDGQKLSAMWAKMGPLMLAKCAEMLALRKAFPQDLSGLYSSEEMQQAGGTPAVAVEPPAPRTPAQPQQTAIATPKTTRDWAEELARAETLDATSALYREAEALGELGLTVGLAGDKDDGSAYTVMDLFWARKRELTEVTPPLMDEPVAAAQPRKWLREARLMTNPDEVRALYMEAVNAKVDQGILDELLAMTQSLHDPAAQEPQQAGQWAQPEIAAEDSWVEDPPGSGEYRESGVPAVLQGGDEQ